MKPLFVASVLVKRAQPEGGELPRDVSQWAMRIRDEWYKVAPYAYQYPTEIVIDELTDPERGAAFGHILVTSKTDLGSGQAMGQMGTELGIRTAKIPIIVEDFRLYPLDMIKTEEGKIIPLNEQRLGEALFRPAAFDTPFQGDVNDLFGGPLYPPERDKVSSFPILEGIADSIYGAQLDRFVGVLEKDAALRDAALGNPIVRNYVSGLSGISPAEPLSKVAGLTGVFHPDVMLVHRDRPCSDVAEGVSQPFYSVKTALRRAYEDGPWTHLPRGVALKRLGPEIVKQADVKGMVIVIRRRPDESEPLELSSDRPSLLGNTGPCRAFGGGRGMGGWLLTKVIDALTGGRSPMRLFSDGEQFGYQDDIGALPDEAKTTLPSTAEPQGLGSFCWEDAKGEVSCTEPVRCLLTSEIDGRKAHDCETLDGRQVKLVKSPSVRIPSPGETGTLLIPESARWVMLGDKMVKLDTAAQVSNVVEKSASVCTIEHSGGTFSIRGLPLVKIGERTGVGPIDAMFTLGLLGFSKEGAERILAKAMRRGQVKISGVRPVVPLSELAKEAMEKTAAEGTQLDELIEPVLAASLGMIKQATSLGDASSVDAILSLGFLNIDNVSRFVAFVPDFEKVQSRIGTLLLAARLGLTELPQDHLVRVFFALEQSLAGLKRLSARLSAPAQA